MKLNGIAHIQLSVKDVAKSREFYKPLFEFFDMKVIADEPGLAFYAVGSRTGICLTPACETEEYDAFQQRRIGLHHFCLRARAREDIDAIAEFVPALPGATLVHGAQEDNFAPGYYSVLFEDPDGIRIEVNFVPGVGHLDSNSDGVPVGMLGAEHKPRA